MFAQLAEEFADEGERLFGDGVFGDWSEIAVLGIGFDGVGENGFLGAGVGGPGFGEVAGGDLEAVEEETGAAGIDLVSGDAAEDFADGELDAGAVFGEVEVEDGLGWVFESRAGDRFAGGVMVVAEVLSAEGPGAAAAAVREEVAALVNNRCGVWHVVYPPGCKSESRCSRELRLARSGFRSRHCAG